MKGYEYENYLSGIGLRLRTLRQYIIKPNGRKFTQDDLARLLDVTRQTIINWETDYSRRDKGNPPPQIEGLLYIVELTGCSLDWLVRGQGELPDFDAVNKKIQIELRRMDPKVIGDILDSI